MAKRYGDGAAKAFRKWWKRTKKTYAKRRFKASFYLFAKSQNAKTRTSIYWRRRKAFYLTLLYFLVAALVVSLAQLWFADVKPETAFGFYTAAGAMAGGFFSTRVPTLPNFYFQHTTGQLCAYAIPASVL